MTASAVCRCRLFTQIQFTGLYTSIFYSDREYVRISGESVANLVQTKKYPFLKLRIYLRGLLRRHLSGDFLDYRQVIAIILPIMVDQAFVFGSNLINTAMISSTGVAAVSAVNMVDSINIFLVSVFVAVSTGGTVVVAQYKGRGDNAMVSKSAAGSVTSVFLFALVISALFLVLHKPVLSVLFGTAAPDVMANARIYFIGSCLSYCGIAAEESVCGALRGIGESRSALSLSLIMNLSYVGFNLVFINALHLGVLGMSISVNLSRYLGAACALFYLIRVNLSLRFRWQDMFHVQFALAKRILFIGLPFAAEQMFFNGGKILTQIFIVGLGTYSIAVNAICNSVLGVIQIPGNALLLSIVTVVGQCIGYGSLKDAKKFIRNFLLISSASYIFTDILTIPILASMSILFHAPAAILPTISLILLVNAIAQIPAWSLSFVLPSALRAAGDSKFTSIISMLSMWLFRLGVGLLLGFVLKLGIAGFWFAMDAEWFVRGAIFLYRFRGNKWYAHHVID